MALYHLLSDRASINILKILHDNEFVDKNAHTMRYSEILDKVSVQPNSMTLTHLSEAGLVTAEKSEHNGLVISITQRGKDFVQQFDKLRAVLTEKKPEQKAYQVQYELTPVEQRILLLCSKMKSESGSVVQLKSLTQEVYPYKDPESKSGSVSKSAKRLEELNLIVRIKDGSRTYFDVTETGERVIKEQFMNVTMPTI
jgi:DNA-binding MarR family transcriptional regulator